MYNIRYSSSPTCSLSVITVNGSYTGPTGPQWTDGITRNTQATGYTSPSGSGLNNNIVYANVAYFPTSSIGYISSASIKIDPNLDSGNVSSYTVNTNIVNIDNQLSDPSIHL
jgi:hypothetical protein